MAAPPTSRKSTKSTNFVENGDLAYVVAVVTELGRLHYSDQGEHPPLRAAMMMVADHFAENARREHNVMDFTITAPTAPDAPVDPTPIHIRIED
jgi:hypothetical protein